MSLTTQLTRGTLALPMLALFAALALAAGPAPEAQANAPKLHHGAHATATATATATTIAKRIELRKSADTLLIVRVGEAGNCDAPARPQLLLAQAPADLGPLAQRQGAGCRA